MLCAHCGLAVENAPERCPECNQPPLLEDRYRLETVVGQGASGITYRATDTQTDHIVCVKELSWRTLVQAGGQKPWDLFQREARVLQQLDHPGIPRYLDHFSAGRGKTLSMYLVQEFIDGQNLAQALTHQRLQEEEAWTIAEEILQILDYLQALNPPVIHRDVKPSNVIRRSDGRLALIDFGSVRDVLKAGLADGSTVAGTYGYMAPEQFQGHATSATDLYGLGCLLVVLLSQKDPLSMTDLHHQLQWRPHVRVSKPMQALLSRLLDPDPTQRIQSAREVLALLHDRERLTEAAQAPPEEGPRLADPWAWPLLWVRAAVLQGATAIKVKVGRESLSMAFDGTPFSTGQLEALAEARFLPATEGNAKAHHLLAVGTYGLEALQPIEYTIHSGSVSARWDRESRGRVVRAGKQKTGTTIKVNYGAAPDDALPELARKRGAARTTRLIRDCCQHTPIPVKLDGGRISWGLEFPEAVVQVPMEVSGAQGHCGLLPTAVDPEVRFVADGVWVDTVPLRGAPAGAVAVVSHPELTMNTDHEHLVRDAVVEALLKGAEAGVGHALERLDAARTEAIVYDPDGGAHRRFGIDDTDRKVPFSPWHLGRQVSWAVRALEILKPLLRVAATGLYLSPLFIVPKAVLFFLDMPEGDWLVVGFVGLVLLFFSLLALTALMFVVAGPRSKRQILLSFTGGDDLMKALAQRGLGAPGATRVQGRITGGASQSGAAVVRELWLAREDRALRLTTSRPFALRHDERHVLVDPVGAPWLVGPATPDGASTALTPSRRRIVERWISDQTQGRLGLDAASDAVLEIHDGAMVTVVAPAASAVPTPWARLAPTHRQVLEATLAPGEMPPAEALVVTGTPSDPLVLSWSNAGGDN